MPLIRSRSLVLSFAAVALLAATVVMGSRGAAAEPAHPILPPSGSASGASGLMSSYSESQFLDFVPRQAPRDGSFAPAVVAGDTGWSWSPAQPNQLKSTPSGTIFPNASYPEYTDSVPVLSGKTVTVRWYAAAGGGGRRSLVYGYIDNEKRDQLRSYLTTLAAAYLQSGSGPADRDDRFARRIALALDAWAACVPDYFMTQKNSPSFISAEGFTRLSSDIQRASDHNGIAHEWSDVELRAFDAIYDSKALADLSAERGYDVRQAISAGLFFNIGDYFRDRVPLNVAIATNLSDPFTILAKVARVLNRPDYILWMGDYLSATVQQKIMRDGVLGEGIAYSWGYLDQNLGGAQATRDYFLTRAADTPALAALKTAAANDAAILQGGLDAWRGLALPNGELPAFGDTTFGSKGARNAGASGLLPAYGHVALGAGAGDAAVQLNQNFPDDANHMRADVTAFTLWASGTELLGNIRYYNPTPGRQFDEQILSHNAVTIDRTNMGRDGWDLGARDHVFTAGNLTLFEPGLNGLAMTEVDGGKAYANKASRYQRLLFLNTVDLTRPYVVDVFRVSGGATHDYTFHGSIRFDQTSECSIPLTANSDPYPLLEAGEKWSEPTSSGSTFPYYGFFRNVSSGTAPENFQVTYRDTGTAHRDVTLWVTGQAGATVLLGRTPNPERSNNVPANFYKYWRPSLIVRRRIATGAQDSLFANVIEPLRGGVSSIRSVERLPLAGGGQEAVALRIVFVDGRTDTYLVNLHNPRVSGATGGSDTIATADGKYALTGRVGATLELPDGSSRVWTVGAEKLQSPAGAVDSLREFQAGTIQGVMRRADGADQDAFVTDAALPQGTVLRGRQLSLTFGTYHVIGSTDTQEGISQMFAIDHVEVRDGRTWVVLAGDPELRMTGDQVTELMAPQRVFTGPCTFEIVTSDSKSFSAEAAPVVTLQPVSQTIAAGATVSLAAAAESSTPLTYQWTKDGAPIAGATAATLTLAHVSGADSGDYRVAVTDARGQTTVSRFARVLVADPVAGHLANLSVRAMAGTDGQPLIGGLVVAGGACQLLIRAVGPSLSAFGVADPMPDPRLEIHRATAAGDELVAANDNWADPDRARLQDLASSAGAFPLADAASRDSAVAIVADGPRTVHVAGAPGTGGVVLMEVYEAGASSGGRLVNVSCRHFVGTGTGALIVGFSISGNVPQRVLMRAVGPTLSDYGVAGPLGDPALELYTDVAGKSVLVAQNDNWGDEPAAGQTASVVGAFPLRADSRDAALLMTLPAGTYTAIVRGVNSATGEALAEVYEVPGTSG